jgi:hypothetical protein
MAALQKAAAASTPASAIIQVGGAGSEWRFAYGPVSTPAAFGTGGYLEADAATGDIFGTDKTFGIWVSPTYVSQAPLAGTATWTGKDFGDLGVTPGTYQWTWGTGANADSFTLQIGPVPEPQHLALAAGLGLLGFGWWRRGAKRA